MYRPNRIGPHDQFDFSDSANSILSWTAANYNSVDSDLVSLSPQIPIAPIPEELSQAQYLNDSSTARSLAAGMTFAFGSTLTAEPTLGNLLLTMSGAARVASSADGLLLFPFLGRRADTSAPTVARNAPENTLSTKWIIPPNELCNTGIAIGCSVNETVITRNESETDDPGSFWCAGWAVQNPTGAAITLNLLGHMTFHKYKSDVMTFDPSR